MNPEEILRFETVTRESEERLRRALKAEAEVERWREIKDDEVATNMRIAQRLGFWAAIEAGKSYEDAEVEAFERVVEALKYAIENGLQHWSHTFEDVECPRCKADAALAAAQPEEVTEVHEETTVTYHRQQPGEKQ